MSLPNFMIIGVAKAGTTSLYRYLDQHPQVFMCPDKGTNYFGYEDARNWRWTDEGQPPLLRHFQATTIEEYEAFFKGVTDEIAIGEVSPQYLRCPTAARRIHDCIPEVKIVASLRNPADRAFSGFMMRTRRGEAVKSVYEELTPKASHVQESLYFKRLKRYYDIFPRQQIKVYVFEEFKKDPVKIVTDLFDFLGVDTGFIPDTSTKHIHAAVPKNRVLNQLFYNPNLIAAAKWVLPKSLEKMAKRLREQNMKVAPKLPKDLRDSLLDLYREDIHKLEELRGRDLSVWLV